MSNKPMINEYPCSSSFTWEVDYKTNYYLGCMSNHEFSWLLSGETGWSCGDHTWSSIDYPWLEFLQNNPSQDVLAMDY